MNIIKDLVSTETDVFLRQVVFEVKGHSETKKMTLLKKVWRYFPINDIILDYFKTNYTVFIKLSLSSV